MGARKLPLHDIKAYNQIAGALSKRPCCLKIKVSFFHISSLVFSPQELLSILSPAAKLISPVISPHEAEGHSYSSFSGSGTGIFFLFLLIKIISRGYYPQKKRFYAQKVRFLSESALAFNFRETRSPSELS